jgi:hypothetical protein
VKKEVNEERPQKTSQPRGFLRFRRQKKETAVKVKEEPPSPPPVKKKRWWEEKLKLAAASATPMWNTAPNKSLPAPLLALILWMPMEMF